MSLKNSNDTIGNQTRDLPVCSVVLNHYATARPTLPYYSQRIKKSCHDLWGDPCILIANNVTSLQYISTNEVWIRKAMKLKSPLTCPKQKLCGRVQLKCDGTRWRTGGEVKEKLANGVGSQYSYTTSEHGASSFTTTDAHTSAASSRLNWCPSQFKLTCLFRRKMKSVSCVCAITFQMQSTTFRCAKP